MDIAHIKKIAGLDVTDQPKQITKQVRLTESFSSIMKMAGLQSLNESHITDDSEDDSDDDVKKADAELKKKNIKLPNAKVNVQDDLEHIAPKTKAKPEEKQPAKAVEKAETKKEADSDSDDESEDDAAVAKRQKASTSFWSKQAEKATKPVEDKKEAPAKKEAKSDSESEGPKKRGKAPQPESKTGKLRTWMLAHPNHTKAEARAYGMDVCGMTTFGFNTMYGNIKQKMKVECFVIRHPSVKSFILHENYELKTYQWVSESSLTQDPMLFQHLSEAQEVAQYLHDFKNQQSMIERIPIED